MDEKTFKPSEMAFAILAIPGGVDGTLILRVTAPPGSLVKAEKDGKTYSALEDSGVWDIHIPQYGTYLVTARLLESEKNIYVDVNPTEVKIAYNSTFGVCWDYSNPSTALERLQPDTDPYGYVNVRITKEPVSAVGTGIGSSPFDDYIPWKGMEQYNILLDDTIIKRGEEGFSQTEHDTMVYIPEFYYKVIDVPEQSKRYWYISDNSREGFEKHPGSGRYIGRYLSGNTYVSKSNTEVLSNITISTARNESHRKGKNWWLVDYATISCIRLLYLIEYADWDSQSKIGISNIGNNGTHTGVTDTKIYHTGSSISNSIEFIQYRWIENIYGPWATWIDGFIAKGNKLYYSLDNQSFSLTNNYIDTELSAPPYSESDIYRYITMIGYSNSVPWSFIPTKVSGGSSTTYIPDSAITYTQNIRVYIMPTSDIDVNCIGIFGDGITQTDVTKHPVIASRLIYIPKEE